MNFTGTDIVEMLRTNDKAVCRALVVLHERQTEDEKNSEYTRHENGRGFRPCHARMGSSMAKFYLKRGYLTQKQIAYWRKEGREGMRIAIYWRQLLDEAAKKATKKLLDDAAKKVQIDATQLILISEEEHLEHEAERDAYQRQFA